MSNASPSYVPLSWIKTALASVAPRAAFALEDTLRGHPLFKASTESAIGKLRTWSPLGTTLGRIQNHSAFWDSNSQSLPCTSAIALQVPTSKGFSFCVPFERTSTIELTPDNEWSHLFTSEEQTKLWEHLRQSVPSVAPIRSLCAEWTFHMYATSCLPLPSNAMSSGKLALDNTFVAITAPPTPGISHQSQWSVRGSALLHNLPHILLEKLLAQRLILSSGVGVPTWDNLHPFQQPKNHQAYFPYWVNATNLSFYSPYGNPPESSDNGHTERLTFGDILAHLEEQTGYSSSSLNTVVPRGHTLDSLTDNAESFLRNYWRSALSC